MQWIDLPVVPAHFRDRVGDRGGRLASPLALAIELNGSGICPTPNFALSVG
jgi:hypothetical protein